MRQFNPKAIKNPNRSKGVRKHFRPSEICREVVHLPAEVIVQVETILDGVDFVAWLETVFPDVDFIVVPGETW